MSPEEEAWRQPNGRETSHGHGARLKRAAAAEVAIAPCADCGKAREPMAVSPVLRARCPWCGEEGPAVYPQKR